MFDSGGSSGSGGWRWVTAALLVAAGGWWLSAVPIDAAPTLETDDASAGLATLEETVSRTPANVEALAALAESYLERSAPGLAQAALDRAPALHGRARIADLRARSLLDLGLVAPALASQERALEACANPARGEAESCSRAMLARAERRVRWLRELARLRVDDNLADPVAASLAYRLATREVRLAVP